MLVSEAFSALLAHCQFSIRRRTSSRACKRANSRWWQVESRGSRASGTGLSRGRLSCLPRRWLPAAIEPGTGQSTRLRWQKLSSDRSPESLNADRGILIPRMPVCQNPQTVLRNLPKPIAVLSLRCCEKTYPSATLLFDFRRLTAEKAVVPAQLLRLKSP
jgi:hypothetical protein